MGQFRQGDALIVLGAGLMGAWINALFMGQNLARNNSLDSLSTIQTISFSFLSLILLVGLLITRRSIRSMSNVIVASLAACAGTLAAFFASNAESPALLIVSEVFIGFGYSVLLICWATQLMQDDMKRTCVLVSGNIAVSALVTALFAIVKQIAVPGVVAAMPIASLLLYSVCLRNHSVDDESPQEKAPRESEESSANRQRPFGFAPTFLVAVTVFMLCYGYGQPIALPTELADHDQAIQMANTVVEISRGLSAFTFFLFVVFANVRPATLYRLGFYVMIAAYFVMVTLPLQPHENLPVNYIAKFLLAFGYVFFEIFSWTVIAETALFGSFGKERTFLFSRIFVQFGMVFGIVLSNASSLMGHFQYLVTASAGLALVVAATLFVNDGTDLWSAVQRGTFKRARTILPKADNDAIADAGLAAYSRKWMLTPRETEIFALLLSGRTLKKIGEELCISDNTVTSHARHIYRKAGVKSRQELIDLIADTH